MENFVLFIALFIVNISFTIAKLPEEDLTVPELIKYWGYPVEIHEAKTDDGYYLTLHRIPYGRNHLKNATDEKNKTRPVVFLQHGLLCSSSDWLTNFPKDSLGFMLADAGYDVWLGNIRGNTYSMKHDTFSVDSDQFWNFSLDEMAKYDIPCMIGYILQNTSHTQLYYVGHSQGTMMMFAGLSENEELQKKIKIVFMLAPITRLSNVLSPVKYLAHFESIFKMTAKMFGINRFLPSDNFIKFLADKICPIDEQMCAAGIYLLGGYDKKNLNQTRLPVYLSHYPAGTSVKNMFHLLQLLRSNVFQKYDYGEMGNLIRYHTSHPPIYHFETIKIPVVLISGSNDWLAVPENVQWIAEKLPNVISSHEIPGYNHFDFIWGMTASKNVYEKIINALSQQP